jgi:hypothetical protein
MIRSTIALDERNETGRDEVSSVNAGCKQAMICYNQYAMSQPTPIDITNMPDLVRIAEEVEATRKPRVLKRDNTPIAILTPVTKKQSSQATSKAINETLALAGAWSDLDFEEMLNTLDHIRHDSQPTPPFSLDL